MESYPKETSLTASYICHFCFTALAGGGRIGLNYLGCQLTCTIAMTDIGGFKMDQSSWLSSLMSVGPWTMPNRVNFDATPLYQMGSGRAYFRESLASKGPRPKRAYTVPSQPLRHCGFTAAVASHCHPESQGP